MSNEKLPGQPIRVLMLEDDPKDADLNCEELTRWGLRTVSRRVDTPEAFTASLRDFTPDVILMDCVMAGFSALTALKLSQKIAPDVPVIIVTGVLLDAMIAELLRSGATDYLLKDRLSRLGSAVSRALAERRSRETLIGALARMSDWPLAAVRA